jgi:hypothetical protein
VILSSSRQLDWLARAKLASALLSPVRRECSNGYNLLFNLACHLRCLLPIICAVDDR